MYRGVDFLREKHSATLNRRTMFSRINDFKGGVKTDIFFIFSKSYPGGVLKSQRIRAAARLKPRTMVYLPAHIPGGGDIFRKRSTALRMISKESAAQRKKQPL